MTDGSVLLQSRVGVFMLTENSPSQTHREAKHEQDQREADPARTWSEVDEQDHEDTEHECCSMWEGCDGCQEPAKYQHQAIVRRATDMLTL